MKICNDAEYQAVIHELKKGRDGDYSVRIYDLMYSWKLTENDVDFIVVMTPGYDNTPDPEREYLIDPSEFFSAIESAFDYPFYAIDSLAYSRLDLGLTPSLDWMTTLYGLSIFLQSESLLSRLISEP